MEPRWLFAGAVSLIVSLIGIYAVRRIFPKLGLMDQPELYGHKRHPVPYSAGVVVYLVYLITALFLLPWHGVFVGLFCAATLIVCVSLLDDRYKLSPFIRLGAQIVAALILVASGIQIQLISNPFGAPLMLDSVAVPMGGATIWFWSTVVIVVWMVLMMNVMNWIDGVPGLASGVSGISHAAILLLSLEQFHLVDQTYLSILAAAIAITSIVLCVYEFDPPKILIGDAGSMFLGFMLGTLSIFSGGKFATALLVMLIPVVDAVVVIVARLIRGKSPFKGDYTHFHHRMLRAGFSKRQTVLIYLVITMILGAISIFLTSTLLKAIAFGVGVVVLFIVGIFLEFRSRMLQ